MATTQTMATLLTLIRQRADQIGSQTFDDNSELKPWIRSSLRQLHLLFTQQDAEWTTVSIPLSLSAGVEAYTLPSNLLRLSSVFCLFNYGANRIKLSEFQNDDFGALNFPIYATTPYRYRLYRNLMYIQPTPTADYYNALEIMYVPEFRNPLLDYTPIGEMLPSGAAEWIVLDVLQKMSVKTRLQNMDDIVKSKADVERRLKTSIRTRSDNAPRMRDAYSLPRTIPYVGYSAPSGPLYWATA